MSVHIIEATGVGDFSRSEQELTGEMKLLGLDVFSDEASSGDEMGIRLDQYGTPQWSFERWFYLEFREVEKVADVKLWFPTGLTSEAVGWSLYWGTSSTFETPVATPSRIAVHGLSPISNPSQANIAPGALSSSLKTDWVVLQGRATGAAFKWRTGFVPLVTPRIEWREA